MKTDVIVLNPFDNIDSVLDKLTQVSAAAGSSPRYLLLWPKRGRILVDSVDYARIWYWAAARGFQLAIVSSNDFVRKSAREHAIPLFSTREEAVSEGWPPLNYVTAVENREERQKYLSGLKQQLHSGEGKKPSFFMYLILMTGVLAALFLIAFSVFPHAEVYLPSPEAVHEESISFWTDESITEITQDGGIPSRKENLPITISVSVPATGSVSSSPALAAGNVTLKNSCGQSIYLDAGTRVSTAADGGLDFGLLDSASVPANGELSVPVQAARGGSAWNLPADSVTVLLSKYDQCITVSQPDPVSGGDDGVHPSPSPADYQAALTEIGKKTLSEAEKQISDRDGNLRMLLSNTIQVDQIISEKLSPDYGYIGDTLKVDQTLMISFRTVSRQDVFAAVQNQMNRTAESGFEPQAVSLDWQVSAEPVNQDGKTIWQVSARQNGIQKIDEQQVQALIAGRTRAEALEILQQTFGLKQEPRIILYPSRLTHLPRTEVNILVHEVK